VPSSVNSLLDRLERQPNERYLGETEKNLDIVFAEARDNHAVLFFDDAEARLDLTGAGIVGAAQTAALYAARESTAVAMRHVVRGLVRQYQREPRVLGPAQLAQHAHLLHEGT